MNQNMSLLRVQTFSDLFLFPEQGNVAVFAWRYVAPGIARGVGGLTMWKSAHGFWANTVPFHMQELNVFRFWHPQGVVEPSPGIQRDNHLYSAHQQQNERLA
jgi:hypothetical protein